MNVPCRRCKKMFAATRNQYICPPCKPKRKRERQKEIDNRKKLKKMAGEQQREMNRTKSVVVRMTTAQQQEHDRNLQRRLYADCQNSAVVIIRPGDPMFKRIVKEITPIERVRNSEFIYRMF